MSIAALLGVAAAGLSGYQRGKIESEDRDQERLRQEQDSKLRDAQIQGAQLDLQRKQQDFNDQSLIRSSGMNVSPESSDSGPMPEGQSFRVAGQGFADAGQAQAAATAMNSPEAKTARRLGVLRSINPEQADKEEKSGMELQKYRHDFTKGMEDEGTMAFIDQNMGQAPSVDDIKAGKAGQFQLSGVDSFNKVGSVKIPSGATGKWQVLTLPNGREVPDFVVNGEDGKQFYPMSARTLQAIHGMTMHERENQADSQFTQGSTIKHQRTMEGIAQQHADSEERHWKDQMRLLSQKVAEAGVGGASTQTVSLKDVRDFEDDANKRITEIFQPKEGADANERAALGSQRNQLVAKASTLFQQNALRGGIFTPGLILQAMDLERDPKNVQTIKWSDGNVYRTVNVNGTLVMVGGALAQKEKLQQPISDAPARKSAASSGIESVQAALDELNAAQEAEAVAANAASGSWFMPTPKANSGAVARMEQAKAKTTEAKKKYLAALHGL